MKDAWIEAQGLAARRREDGAELLEKELPYHIFDALWRRTAG